MGYETSLRLIEGVDQHLRSLAYLMTLCGIIAALFSPAGIYLTTAFCSACIVAFVLLLKCDRTGNCIQLVLSADGHAQWLDKQGKCCDGLMMHVWCNNHYAVLQIRSGKMSKRFVISRSLQHSGEFRTLLSWLRLGRAKSEAEQV